MTAPDHDATTVECIDLLTHYSFDLGGYAPSELVSRWQRYYPDNWLRLAIIEALYQGRYKAVSVDQILALWQRRHESRQRFSHEFERMVCSKLPRNLNEAEPALFQDPTPPDPALPDPASRQASTGKADPSGEQSQAGPMATPATPAPSPGRPDAGKPTCPEPALQAPVQSTPTAQHPAPVSGQNPPDSPKPPSTSPDQEETDSIQWSQDVTREPIRQFEPTIQPSETYTKLRAVSRLTSLTPLDASEMLVVAEDANPEGVQEQSAERSPNPQ
jgi:hypothetical protein